MPTYEFRCPQGHEFEKFFRSISTAENEMACPQCGEVSGRKMSAGAGLLFKGSGFYLTDYGKNAHRGAPAAEGGKGEGNKAGSKPAGGEGGSSGGGDAKGPGGTSTGGSPASGGSSSGGSSSGGSSSGGSSSGGSSGGASAA